MNVYHDSGTNFAVRLYFFTAYHTIDTGKIIGGCSACRALRPLLKFMTLLVRKVEGRNQI